MALMHIDPDHTTDEELQTLGLLESQQLVVIREGLIVTNAMGACTMVEAASMHPDAVVLVAGSRATKRLEALGQQLKETHAKVVARGAVEKAKA